MTFVLLQLVLVESGYACRMDTSEMPSGGSMVGMQTPGDETMAPPQHEQDEAPCRFPWAPGGCQSMAPCAPAAVTVAAVEALAACDAAVTAWQLVQLAPPPVTQAPELPPPRA